MAAAASWPPPPAGAAGAPTAAPAATAAAAAGAAGAATAATGTAPARSAGPRRPAGRARRRLGHADDLQVEPAVAQVGARELALDRVGELEDPLPALADQAVRFRLVQVIVVGEGADRHQAVDVEVLELHEEAERLDPGDPAVEALARAPGQEAHLLPLQEVALRLLGP